MPIPCLAFFASAFAASGDELVQAYASPPSRADYVFLLDTAGQQKVGADAARADVAAFVEAVPTGDSVAVVVFHTRPSTVLEPVVVDEAGRAALVEKIRTLELPTAKEEDLGAGLAQAGDVLNRADGSAAQFLFVVSNFCHNPPLTSEWDSGGRDCRAIKGLSVLAGKLKVPGGRQLTSWVFPVSTKDNTGKDRAAPQLGVDAALQVLREAGGVELAATPFSPWLQGFRNRLPLERVRPLAHAEAARATLSARVARAPTAEDLTAKVELSSGLRNLQLRLDEIQVDGAVPGSWPAQLVLSPNAELPVEIALPDRPFSLFPRTETLTVPLVVHARGTVEPSAGLAAADVDAARPDLRTEVELTFERSYGMPAAVGFGVLSTVFVVGGFGAVWVRGRFLPRRLGGSFGYRRGDGPRQPLDISALPEAPIVIGENGRLVVGPAKDAVLVLRMVRPIWAAHAEVEIRGPRGVEINRKPAPPGRHRVVAGATSFQFGEYRLTWE